MTAPSPPLHPAKNEEISALGGYFGLEPTGVGKGYAYRQASGFQSARAAFYTLLQEGSPPKVWLPRYICDAMVAPVLASESSLAFYSLTSDFEVGDDLRPDADDWIVCVRYFGIMDAPLRSAADLHGAERIVADHAQAFFTPPPDCAATLYSPRKFFGVPDGGLLVRCDRRIEPPHDNIWTPDTSALLARPEHGAEAGYSQFLAAERRFDDLMPHTISHLSRSMLERIDMDAVAATRRANFHFLHEKLAAVNGLSLACTSTDAPLCYPLLHADPDLGARLGLHRIYAARYWSDAAARSDTKSFEAKLAARLLALPCDQRYGPEHMQRVIDVVLNQAV